MVYDFTKGLDNYLPMSLLWAYLAAQALGKYQARRERRFLWGLVFGAVASLCFLLCYVLRTWGGRARGWLDGWFSKTVSRWPGRRRC